MPLGARRNGCLQSRGIEVIGFTIRLYRHGHAAHEGNGQPGGNVGVARHDYLVAGLHIQRFQGQVQGIEAIGHPNGMLDLVEGAVFSLKRLHFLPSTYHCLS
jgi:hypothetical protein